MSEREIPAGHIRTEVHGRVFKVIIDNATKKNAFSPEMMAQMSDALTHPGYSARSAQAMRAQQLDAARKTESWPRISIGTFS